DDDIPQAGEWHQPVRDKREEIEGHSVPCYGPDIGLFKPPGATRALYPPNGDFSPQAITIFRNKNNVLAQKSEGAVRSPTGIVRSTRGGRGVIRCRWGWLQYPVFT